jgi:transcriptional regulator with XRE-family HTH domain
MIVNEEYKRRYGDRLKELRATLNLSQKNFAKQLGIAASFLSELEKGKTKPGYNFLINLYETFDISPSWVLLGKGSMYQDKKNGLSSNDGDFGDDSKEIRDLLIYLQKSPLVRATILAEFSKFLLSNEEIVIRDIHHNTHPEL